MAQQPIDLGVTPNDGTGDPLRGGGEKINENFTEVYGLLPTREFNRTFVVTLVFDKNEIFHDPVVMTGNLNLQIGSGGLIDQASGMRFRLTADGVSSITFGTGFDFLYGITNGQVLEAGTYEIYLLYTNGSVSVSVPGVTAQQSGSTTLSAPSGFAAVADGENDLDLSWNNVSGNEGYLIEFSTTGVGGWTELETTAANATTSTQGSLFPGDVRYYRIKTLGDGVTTFDSPFSSVISGQTESTGDITDPAFTFLPANGNVVWPVNKQIVITANEPIRNTDGSEITSNQAGIIILKETNSGGANIAHSWTIDATKQIITITPTITYGTNQLVYVAINNVEDTNNNEVLVAQSITFTTTAFTFFNGASNFVRFGDILDSIIAAGNAKFKFRYTINEQILAGTRFLVGKYSSSDNQRSCYWYYTGVDVYFAWARLGNGASRVIKWTGALSVGEHDLEVIYDGAIDTNNGLDRCILNVDGSPAGSKTLEFADAQGLTDIFNSTAQLSVGTGVNAAGNAAFALYYAYEAKDLVILSGVADVVELNVPVLRTGTDTSGNARHGTWV